MAELLFYEDLSIGDEWTSEERQITEADVAQFADLTSDYDPLHVDEDYAKESPFRQQIAHGLLGMSLMAGLSSECPNVETVAFLGVQDWNFLKPIYFDDSVRAVTKVTRLESNGRRRGKVTWFRQLVNQRDEVVQEGTLQTLVALESASLHRRLEKQTSDRTTAAAD
jgi:acyl dehydratase